MTPSAGANTLLVGPGAKVALVQTCEGFLDGIVTATVTSSGLRDIRRVEPPAAMVRVTGWAADGSALLGARSDAPRGEGDLPQGVLIDPTTGALDELDVEGWWIGQLADGTYVSDRGDEVRVGDVDVPLAGAADGRFARHFAIDPTGTRLAAGSRGGLVVIDGDGVVTPWTDTAVAGGLAWAPLGEAIAFATAAEATATGSLVLAAADGVITPLSDEVVTFEAVDFSHLPVDPTVVFTIGDPARPGDPAAATVTQVPLRA